jgi:catechol 1,2-dioxygenase
VLYDPAVVKTDVRTRPEDISAAAVASFDDCDDARLRELMQAFVRHLHAFAREVELTEQEWADAIRILTETARATDERRNEFILWSDVLGLSMLVDTMAHGKPAGATESTIVGPFWAEGSPLREYGDAIFDRAVGVPTLIHGRVLDIGGGPIAGAELDVWQNDANELYSVQDPETPEDHLRGRFLTREDGSYAFVGVRPIVYPIPSDGPVGHMIDATGRHPWRPAHLHMIITAPGCERLTTHFFDAETDYLDSDAVFAVKPSLLREFVPRSPDDPERPPFVDGEWYSCENDIVLAPAGSS